MKAAVDRADKPTMSRPASKATILVVDDDAPIRALTARALQGKDYDVLVAADGPEAIRMSDAHPSDIHLLLADIMLPSGNGIALARAIIEKRPETAVLYMSGFPAEAIRVVQDGGAPTGGFLEKPFSSELLVDRVGKIVASLKQDKKPKSTKPDHALPVPVAAEELEQALAPLQSSEAVYRLETAVRCPHCGETVSTLKAVRLLRTQVNFTSTLPRRGRVAVCPCCFVIVPVELTNF
jgi:DNA-binding response OmpR family regulator